MKTYRAVESTQLPLTYYSELTGIDAVHAALFGFLALIVVVLSAPAQGAAGAPAEILDSLAATPTEPLTKDMRELAVAVVRAPADVDAAVRLAKAYYRFATTEGELRFIGYARDVLTPWWRQPDPPREVRLMRANLRQYVHAFDAALVDLDALLKEDPDDVQALAVRSNVHVVQANYGAARADCARLRPLINPLIGAACELSIVGLTSRAQQSYARLLAVLGRSRNATPEERVWVLTRLAEMAERLGDAASAERHYRLALSFNRRDQYILASLADLLLDHGRPREVIELLRNRTTAEHLLLRMVLAERAIGAPDADAHRALVGAAFDASRRGGYAVHEGDESRFVLHVLRDPPRALRLALSNWNLQRENRDARAVLEAAVAANAPAAAQAVLDWMRQADILDVRLAPLADQLLAARAQRP